MSIVLAAIDDSAAARPVLEAADALAALLGAQVEAVHVDHRATPGTAVETAAALNVPCRVRRGDVHRELLAEVAEHRPLVLVLGARGLPTGAQPAGHVTLDLAQQLDVALMVVPPDAPSRPMRRVLIGVEGDGESSAVRRLLKVLVSDDGPEIIALHVFEPANLPMFGDAPVHETEAWADEFQRRVLRTARESVQLELRVGDPARTLRETARELDVDLVVLAWNQRLAGGHGRLVRGLLESGDIPLLLLPRPRPRRRAPLRPLSSRRAG